MKAGGSSRGIIAGSFIPKHVRNRLFQIRPSLPQGLDQRQVGWGDRMQVRIGRQPVLDATGKNMDGFPQGDGSIDNLTRSFAR